MTPESWTSAPRGSRTPPPTPPPPPPQPTDQGPTMNTTDTKTAALTAKQIRQQRAADRLLVIEALQGFGPRSAASLAASYTRHPVPDSGFHDIRPDEAFVLLARLGLPRHPTRRGLCTSRPARAPRSPCPQRVEGDQVGQPVPDPLGPPKPERPGGPVRGNVCIARSQSKAPRGLRPRPRRHGGGVLA